MTRDNILALVPLIPEKAPAFGPSAPVGSPSRRAACFFRYDQALTCYNFGLAFVMSLVQAGRPFSPVIHHTALRRAYDFEVHGRHDLPLIQALRYSLPDRRLDLGILTGALVRGESYAAVAQLLNETEEVVYLADQLLFNVHDRLTDEPYIRHVRYKYGIQETLKPDYLTTVAPEVWHLRNFATMRRIEDAKVLSGMAPMHAVQKSAAQVAGEIEANITNEAGLLIEAGGASARVTVISRNMQIATDNKASGTAAGANQTTQHKSLGASVSAELQARDDAATTIPEGSDLIPPSSMAISMDELKAQAEALLKAESLKQSSRA